MYSKNIINELIEGCPPFETIKDMVSKNKEGPSCLIFDDGLSTICQDITRIFYELSHHSNCNVFFVTQNLFFSTKEYRTLSLNSHYLIVMKNPRDQRQIFNLAQQISPFRPNRLIQSYQEATKTPYSYIVLDFKPSTPDIVRIRSRILPSEKPQVVFIERSK